MPGSKEEKERKRKQIAKQCQNLGTMLKRLKRTDDSSQSSQIHDDPIDKGRNRCELLDAEKQQTESDPFKQKESLRKEYFSITQVNAEGKQFKFCTFLLLIMVE